jgi:chromosome segregation ATPase
MKTVVGIDCDNPSPTWILRQGRVQHILQADPSDLFSALVAASGAGALRSLIEQATVELGKFESVSVSVAESITSIEEHISAGVARQMRQQSCGQLELEIQDLQKQIFWKKASTTSALLQDREKKRGELRAILETTEASAQLLQEQIQSLQSTLNGTSREKIDSAEKVDNEIALDRIDDQICVAQAAIEVDEAALVERNRKLEMLTFEMVNECNF